MANYSAATFIAPFASTDIVIGFVNKLGNRTGGINVCQYDKASAEGNELWVFVQDKRQRVLDFESPQEALQAFDTLQSTVNQLLPNCEFVGGSPAAPPQTIESITLTEYKNKQSTNDLTPLQWYDIADTSPVFDLGPTIRVQAKSSDDFQPTGVSLSTDELVTINVLDNTIVRREDTVNKILSLGRSVINHTGSTFLKASTFSTIDATDSTYIEADNHSVIEVTDSDHVKAINNSNVVVDDGDHLFFDNIQEDLTSFAGLLSDIQVNPTETIGKHGRATMSDSDGETLYSYIELVDQETPALTGDVEKILDNAIPSANAEFRINVKPGLGSNTLTIKDSGLTVLAEITSALQDSILTFRWNKNTQLFEFVQPNASENIVALTITSDGQTSFAGLAPVPTRPEKSQLIVNGQVQVYGASEDYHIVGDTLFWVSTNFSLETDDEAVLRYV